MQHKIATIMYQNFSFLDEKMFKASISLFSQRIIWPRFSCFLDPWGHTCIISFNPHKNLERYLHFTKEETEG